MALGLGAAAVSAVPMRSAFAADKVIFRTNWLFYGSHAIFFLGIDKGYYGQDNLDVYGELLGCSSADVDRLRAE